MSEISRNHSEAVIAGQQPERLHPSPTTRHAIEVILARQLAGYLAVPIVIFDPSHVAIYYNEPMERLLGRRFDEGEPIPWADLSKAFDYTDEAGEPVPAGWTMTGMALRDRRVAHRTFWLRGLDGVRRHIDATSIPLIGNAGRFLGAVSIFVEIEP